VKGRKNQNRERKIARQDKKKEGKSKAEREEKMGKEKIGKGKGIFWGHTI